MDVLEVLDVNDMNVERIIRDRSNPFDIYDDYQFKIRYRFNKNTTRNIMNLIYQDLTRETQRHMALSPEVQVQKFLKLFIQCIPMYSYINRFPYEKKQNILKFSVGNRKIGGQEVINDCSIVPSLSTRSFHASCIRSSLCVLL